MAQGGTNKTTVRSTKAKGSISSPTPLTRARPPRKQNGTSLPSWSASRESSTRAHRRIAPASADPPPRPPPIGITFFRRTAARRPARSSARIIRFSDPSVRSLARAPLSDSNTIPSPPSTITSSSARSSVSISASISWRPFSRRDPTWSDHVSFAGAKTLWNSLI